MSDILSNVLKVNQPVSGGYDNNSVRNNPIVPGDTQIQNIVDPSKVVRPDGKGEAEEKQFSFSSESNYENFIQTLKNAPQLMEIFSKLIFTDAQNIITSGLSANFAEELSAFMEMMKMDPEQLLGFLKSQETGSGQFSGVFFQSLREVLNSTGSLELRTGILDFLKHYSDMASGSHLLHNIQAAIDEISPLLFKSDAEQLQEIVGKLIFREDGEPLPLNQMDSDLQQNARIFKEELIPFFSKYVTRTHDLGKPRDIMTLITLNIARYCNGTKASVMQCFEKLLQHGDFNRKLGEIKEENLEMILNRLITEHKRGSENQWTEKLISMLNSGLKESGSYEGKMVFQNIMSAMLLNESVYMPLVHLMLPVNIAGTVMFSEIWVDPDAQNEQNVNAGEEERCIRMLIKFDIKDLGYFDMIVNYQGGSVDLLVAYPPKLAPLEKQVKTGLGQIVENNGLSFHSLILEEGRKPIPLMDVFPKISEGRNSINVRI